MKAVVKRIDLCNFFAFIAKCLKFILPVVFYFVNRRYVWCSILLAVLVGLIINWGNFNYYESRGLMILVTLVQVAVMAIIILILRAVTPKRQK